MSSTSGPSDAPPSSASVSLNPELDYSLSHRVLAFYIISPIDDAEHALEEHRRFLAERQMVGRVYLCGDGMNAQVSGLAHACAEYREWVGARFASADVLFKEDPVDEP
eukprot:5609683-Prymnesium_polylepis.1